MPEGDRRRHTSTVTVAVVEHSGDAAGSLDLADVEIETYRGSGPGGQHRNTSDTGVRARHLPTGIVVKVDRGRSWWQNRTDALAELERRVTAAAVTQAAAASNEDRTAQIGVGDRAGHDWTWTAWRNEVVCHATGARFPMDAALRGRMRLGR